MSFFGRRNQPQLPPKPDPSSEDTTPKSESLPPPVEEIEPEAEPQEPPRPTPNRQFDTALGAGSVLEGKFVSDGNVRMDGKFKGTLEIAENILVGVTAEIEANLEAKNISIAGIVRGNVSGHKVHLMATARVWGDITAQSLITEDGAFIEGKVSVKAPGDSTKLLEISENNIG